MLVRLSYGVNNKRAKVYSSASCAKVRYFSKTSIFLSKYNKHPSVNIFGCKFLQYLFKNQTHIYTIICVTDISHAIGRQCARSKKRRNDD